MQRKIASPFEYYDYRQILHDDYLSRSTLNHQYSFRAYSRDLSISPGFLSDVLHAKKDLSVSSCRKVFGKLGFDDLELEYCERLVQMKSRTHKEDREEAQAFVDKHYKHVGYQHDSRVLKIIDSLEHMLAYGIARRCPEVTLIKKLFRALGLPDRRVLPALKDLHEEGLVVLAKGRVQIINEWAKISHSENLPQILNQFSNLLFNSIIQKGIEVPHRIAQGSILNFDNKTFEEATQAHMFFIKKLNRLAQGTKKTNRYVFLSSALIAIPEVDHENFFNPSKKE